MAAVIVFFCFRLSLYIEYVNGISKEDGQRSVDGFIAWWKSLGIKFHVDEIQLSTTVSAEDVPMNATTERNTCIVGNTTVPNLWRSNVLDADAIHFGSTCIGGSKHIVHNKETSFFKRVFRM